MDLPINQILIGDAIEQLKTLPDCSVHCCVTSPPYWGLRDYGVEGQLGLEKTPEEYVSRMVELFREVRRVLRDDGTLWLNLGDSYNAYNHNRGPSSSISAKADVARPDSGRKKGDDRREMEDGTQRIREHPRGLQGRPHDRSFRQLERGLGCQNLKAKDLIGIPWRVAFALQADGWYLRLDIIWSKPNPMPESVTDRPTKAHEYLFLMSKRDRYYYDHDSVREPHSREWWKESVGGEKISADRRDGGDRKGHGNPTGRNRRSVWEIPTSPFPDAHFAVFPEKLIEPCILAGCPAAGIVLDPFMGAGTTALVALKADRKFIGIELNPDYAKMADKRIWQEKNQGRLA